MIKGRWHLMALLKFCCCNDRNAIFLPCSAVGRSQHTHTHTHACACVRVRPVCLHISDSQAVRRASWDILNGSVILCIYNVHRITISTYTQTHTPTHPEGLCWCSTPFKTSEPRQQRNQSDLTGHPCANHSRGINKHFLCFENTAALVHHTDREKKQKKNRTITHLYLTF